MPPWAALECERTGWTLLMMPTDAPASAAARAARCPARPAPMTRTSCSGIPRGECGGVILLQVPVAAVCDASQNTWLPGRGGRSLERAPHAVDGHDAAQVPLRSEE